METEAEYLRRMLAFVGTCGANALAGRLYPAVDWLDACMRGIRRVDS